MYDDLVLRQEVEANIDRCANVDLRQIGVAVKQGIVTLAGHVGTPAERIAAQEASQAINGVRAVVNEIKLNSAGDSECVDAAIAEGALEALQSSGSSFASPIYVAVHDGCVELRGRVSSPGQKSAVESAVMCVPGVKSFVSDISIQDQVAVDDPP